MRTKVARSLSGLAAGLILAVIQCFFVLGPNLLRMAPCCRARHVLHDDAPVQQRPLFVIATLSHRVMGICLDRHGLATAVYAVDNEA
jgi:hypothetical protein